MEKKISLKNVVRISGAFVACAIGSGFATGQEVLQFFTVFGRGGILGSLVNTVLFAFCGFVFMRQGYQYSLSDPRRISEFYFGRKGGIVAEIFLQVILYGVFVIMIAGTGATLNEFFHLSPVSGSVLMAVLVFFTVILGLEKLSDILGGIGPVIIVFALLTGLYGIFTGHLSFGEEFAASASEILPASSNWFFSSVLYPGFNAVVVLFLSCSLGAQCKSREEASLGGALGGVLFGLAVLIMDIALASNLSDVAFMAVPTLVIAQRIARRFAVIFAVIICCGIYTTAVPMLWSTVRHFAEDRTKKSFVTALVLSGLGLILGMSDFKKLVNLIYPYSGYVGLLLILSAFLRLLRAPKKEAAALRTPDR